MPVLLYCLLTSTIVQDKTLLSTVVLALMCYIMKQETDTELTLKTLRESANLTQPELSRRANIGIRIIGDWEAGRKLPRLDRAVVLARELGVSLKTLAKAMKLDVEGVPDDESD